MNKNAILMVEDNPDDIELTMRAFRQSRITNEVVIVSDGQQALDFLFGEGAYAGRDTSEAPALILLDLKLPKVNGMEVLERIRTDERTSLLPVVILTSSKEEKDLAEGYGLRANSYIRKPVDFKQFAAAIEQIGLYWIVLNEPPPSQ